MHDAFGCFILLCNKMLLMQVFMLMCHSTLFYFLLFCFVLFFVFRFPLSHQISGAAVSRSWGDKVLSWCDGLGLSLWRPQSQGIFSTLNIFAGLLQTSAVVLLLGEVEVGVVTIKIFTILKLLLVIFMILAGLHLFDYQNIGSTWTPHGASGVFRGATSAFFGFLGYDEVCCLSGEALHPKEDIPRAIFGTIACVTVLYVLASLALVGMVPSTHIDEESGFAVAFQDRGWHGACFIVALGEIVTLPLVVVIAFLAQPRLLFAMADDGLLPRLFAEVNSRGNLFKGTLVAGVVCVLIAFFVPFTYLDDMISAGVLLSFNLTNTSLVVLRRQNPRNPGACLRLVVWFNVFGLMLALLCVNLDMMSYEALFPAGVLCVTLLLGFLIASTCPEVEDICRREKGRGDASTYRVPCMPWPPLFGIFINYFLIAQLSWCGLVLICLYTALAVVFYLVYGITHSLGNNTQWVRALRSRSDDDLDHEGGFDQECCDEDTNDASSDLLKAPVSISTSTAEAEMGGLMGSSGVYPRSKAGGPGQQHQH